MSVNPTIERWNIIDTAEMAVSVDAAISRLISNKKLPFDFEEAVDRGIAFLEEAVGGGAILCGSAEVNEFTGTLSPMEWSTDVYLDIEMEKEESESYVDIVNLLSEFKTFLSDIKVTKALMPERRKIASLAHHFFGSLATTLMKQADPLTKTYSHSISL